MGVRDQAVDCAPRAMTVSIDNPTYLHDLHGQRKNASRSFDEKPIVFRNECEDVGC